MVAQFERVEVAIDRAAATRPEHIALICGSRQWTYAQLQHESVRRAALLLEAGLQAGAVAVSAVPTSDELVITFLACCRVGVVFLPLSPVLTEAELRTLMNRAAPKVIFTIDSSVGGDFGLPLSLPLPLPGTPSHSALQAVGAGALDAEAPAIIRATSSTTGLSAKLAVIPHRYLAWRWDPAARSWWERPDGVYYLPLPNHFAAVDICQTFGLGATLVLSEATRPERMEAEMAAVGATAFWGVPALLHLLCQQETPPLAAPRLEALRVSAAALPLELRTATERRYGIPVVQQYGMTESGYIMTTPRGDCAPDCIGRPFPGVEVRLVSDDGLDATTGELLMRTPGAMLGYLDDVEGTALILRDSWLRSGDLARRDSAGNYYLEGRLGLRINVGGFKVAPEEVEAVLLQHPGVREAAVVARPDPIRGEIVTAVLVPVGQPPAIIDIRSFCRERLAAYKVPRQIEFRDYLPRSPLGKVQRRRL